ncbi:MAG: 30S ribosomal protein S9 [Acidobacteria bacterium]|nr:30S ribosomal protein S9 [Acidobacteriota bacterium]
MSLIQYYGTGKRKTAVARVYLRPGKGNIIVNNRDYTEYFPRELYRTAVKQPLSLTQTADKFDVYVRAKGGGLTGQAEAIRHGIARALVAYNRELRNILKRAGFLTRDARVKERKKYGQRGARARFQFSKR